jgi:hypothetical protein
MSLDPKLAKMLGDVLPEYKEYVNSDGTVCVILKKALYGLVESSKLWYDKLSGLFKANKKERCVVNKVYEGAQLTVAFYVDDLLMSCEDPDGIDWLLHQLKACLSTSYNLPLSGCCALKLKKTYFALWFNNYRTIY